MDEKFLEFWGHFLLAAAKGQRQLDEFSRWLSQGMIGFSDLTAMFRQFYGLGSEAAGEEKDWKAARSAFENSYRAYLEYLGGGAEIGLYGSAETTGGAAEESPGSGSRPAQASSGAE